MKTVSRVETAHDQDYAQLEQLVAGRVAANKGPLFRASVPNIWQLYLNGISEHDRQHYNCSCCRRFLERYGTLVAIGSDGLTSPILWSDVEVPEFFRESVRLMREAVSRAAVSCRFFWNDAVWGQPVTGVWTHLHGRPAVGPTTKDAGSLIAESCHEFQVLNRGLAEYPIEVAQQALRALKSDLLYRSEKALSIAKWFVDLHESIMDRPGDIRRNLVWRAVGSAPPGYCHVKTTVIGSLMDDIRAGMDFEMIKSRWSQKLHPLQYQRPQAAPRDGQIEAAERLFAEMGAARSLERRFATLQDIQQFIWRPSEAAPSSATKPGGIFSHLRESAVPKLDLPAVDIRWSKFEREVLPGVRNLSVVLPHQRSSFYGLMAAVHPDAPPILQWDGLDGKRNTVSWYHYHGGSSPNTWGLSSGLVRVTGIFHYPFHWTDPEKFKHQADGIMFALEGAVDQNHESGIAIFPETLRSEFREVRSVIEAHSKKMSPEGRETGNANGIALRGKGAVVEVLIESPVGSSRYRILPDEE